jgi:hypothetical protein
VLWQLYGNEKNGFLLIRVLLYYYNFLISCAGTSLLTYTTDTMTVTVMFVTDTMTITTIILTDTMTTTAIYFTVTKTTTIIFLADTLEPKLFINGYDDSYNYVFADTMATNAIFLIDVMQTSNRYILTSQTRSDNNQSSSIEQRSICQPNRIPLFDSWCQVTVERAY